MQVSSHMGDILDSIMSSGIYVIREDDHRILYFNKRVKEVVPNMELGDICQEAFNDSCENCPLIKIGDQKCYSAINFNDPFGQFVDIAANRIMWDGNIPAFVITVSEHRMLHNEQDIEMERRRLTMAVSEVYPVIISVNLTQNKYKTFQYSEFTAKLDSQEGSYDDLVYITATIVHDDFKQEFCNTYSREKIKETMADGNDSFSYEFKQLGNDGLYHWVNTQIIRIDNPFNDDIELVFLNKAIDKQKNMEERLHALVNAATSNMPGFTVKFIIKDDNAYILEASDKFYDFFQTTPADYDKGVFWRISDRERARILHLTRANATKRLPIEVVHNIRKKDGSEAWIKVSGSYLYEEDGYPVYYTVLVDISDIKQLQLDREATYNSLPGGVAKFVADDKFTVIEANETFYAITGASSHTFGVGYFSNIYSPDLPNVQAVLKKQREQGKTLNVEYRVVSADGSILWLHMKGQEIGIKNGNAVYQTVVMDITEQKKARLVLEMERERYKAALESSKDILFDYTTGTDELILYESVSEDGGKRKENIYRNFLAKVHAHKIAHIADEERVAQSICKGDYRTTEVRISFDTTKMSWYLVQCMPIYESGNCIRVTGTLRDIDAIKKSEEEMRLMQDRFGMAMTGMYSEIYEFDHRTDICYMLSIAGKVFERIPFDGTIASDMEQINQSQVHPDDREKFAVIYDYNQCKSFFEKGVPEVYLEYRRTKGNGVYKWFSVSVRPSDWDKDVYLVYFKDVDTVKKESVNKQRILADALTFAENANNAKTDFLSRMSHDIRTPMNAIIGMATIAKSHLDNKEKMSDCIDKINYASKFLLSLINDILDMSKIESGKLLLSKEVFRFAGFIKDISYIIYPQASNKGVDIDIHVDDSVSDCYEGDRLRLHQIVMNLLSNAVKFTAIGGHVSLKIYQTGFSDGVAFLKIVVSDTGCGMDEEFLSRIFHPFEQGVNSVAINATGSGLGLSIARNLVTLMGGSIHVDSVVGKGSVFTVNLSLGMVFAPGATGESHDRIMARPDTFYDFSGKRVLLAEDNEINVEIAKTLLEMRNMEVDVVVNGFEAVKKFESSTSGYYDLILMDIRMPVMDGLTAINHIRAMARQDAITVPIAAMTANAFQSDIDNAKACDVNGYIVKPVVKYKMYAVISILLEGGCCFDL